MTSASPESVLFTIGVYGFSEETFFTRLSENAVDLIVDVRAHRGLRGTRYAFANSTRLQQELAARKISYIHRKDLAPSAETRALQKQADVVRGVRKRERRSLGAEFLEAYRIECLHGLDADELVEVLIREGRRPALLCVETEPAACHRSALADFVSAGGKLPVRHLRP